MPNSSAYIRRILSARDIPCPACRYNLRGLTEPQCPECGRAITVLDLRWPRRERTLRRQALRFATGGMIFAAVLAGVNVVSLLEATESASRTPWVPTPTTYGVAIVICLAGVVVSLMVIRRVGSGPGSDDLHTWIAASLCWIAPLASLAVTIL